MLGDFGPNVVRPPLLHTPPQPISSHVESQNHLNDSLSSSTQDCHARRPCHAYTNMLARAQAPMHCHICSLTQAITNSSWTSRRCRATWIEPINCDTDSDRQPYCPRNWHWRFYLQEWRLDCGMTLWPSHFNLALYFKWGSMTGFLQPWHEFSRLWARWFGPNSQQAVLFLHLPGEKISSDLPLVLCAWTLVVPIDSERSGSLLDFRRNIRSRGSPHPILAFLSCLGYVVCSVEGRGHLLLLWCMTAMNLSGRDVYQASDRVAFNKHRGPVLDSANKLNFETLCHAYLPFIVFLTWGCLHLQPLGTYSGVWTNRRTLVLTISNATGANHETLDHGPA